MDWQNVFECSCCMREMIPSYRSPWNDDICIFCDEDDLYDDDYEPEEDE